MCRASDAQKQRAAANARQTCARQETSVSDRCPGQTPCSNRPLIINVVIYPNEKNREAARVAVVFCDSAILIIRSNRPSGNRRNIDHCGIFTLALSLPRTNIAMIIKQPTTRTAGIIKVHYYERSVALAKEWVRRQGGKTIRLRQSAPCVR